MNNNDISKRKETAIARGVGMMTQVYVDRAKNDQIWDVEGNRYIDFASGIAVVNTGHCHPRIIKAVENQLKRFTHTCHQVVPYENYISLAERLNSLIPSKKESKTVFVTTGAEAVENAIKIARAATGRQVIIAFNGGFHGRTFMGMSLTGKVAPYKADFGSMLADVFHVPYPIPQHGISTEASISALHQLIKSEVSAKNIAAVIFEPVQGEGGFYQAPNDFVCQLRDFCDEHGILMIADEIQTGFGRTGKLFAMEHYDVEADMTTVAKSLAGGFPLAAVIGTAEIMDAPNVGSLGGTYGGNPLGIAAAHAVLDIIKEEDLCDRAVKFGGLLVKALTKIQTDVPEISDIRGVGFMSAVEFNHAETGLPDAGFANRVRDNALDNGLILLTCGVYGNVIRFLAPLTISEIVFTEALEILDKAIKTARESK